MNRTISPRPAYLTRLTLFFLMALAALALMGFAARQAQATVYYVMAGGTGNGSSWATAGPLQTIITAAHSGDQVWVKAGTYTGNFTATDGVAVYGHFFGTETSLSQRQLTNTTSEYTTILDGNNSGTVYTIPSSATKSNSFDGFTVQRGNSSGYGGGLNDASADTLIISNCTFTNDSAAYGGGISGGNSALNVNLSVYNCSFTGNTATAGGGFYGGGTSTTITGIVGCVFANNTATVNGAGVYFFTGAGTIANCTFTSNRASDTGGGIRVVNGGTPIITDCKFTGNSPNAIGLDRSGSAAAPVLMKDSLILGLGTSTSDPDGIDVDDFYSGDTSYLTLSNNTIVNTNVGISIASADGAVKAANNVLDGNNGGLDDTGAVPFTSSHNDVYGNTSYGYRGASLSSSDLTKNPLFVNATGSDYHLAPTSPCIDAGDDSYVSSGDTDLDGHARLQGARVDIGCYETLLWTATAVSAAPGGNSHILWTRSDGEASLWTLNSSGVETIEGPTYGPYSGWSAKAVATANDGTSRVLWTNTDGHAGVWTFSADDVETTIGTTYGPYTGWSAKSIGVAGDGTSRVLWVNTNGMAGVWSFNTSDVETLVGPTYGPYSGWSAKSISATSDYSSRVLWTNTNGTAGLWSFNANDVVTIMGTVYGPYSGWSAGAVGTAGDGTSRVLWTNVNGEAGVWSFGTNDAQTLVGPTYGPYSGFGAVSLGVAADGTSRVLWDNASRAAGVWTFGTNDVKTIIGQTYGPY